MNATLKSAKKIKTENKMTKTTKEIEIYNRYIKWLQSNEPIPLYIIDNYKKEIKNLKKLAFIGEDTPNPQF